MPDEHAIRSASIETAHQELLELTHRMLEAIHSGDHDTYKSLCSPDLSCFETDVSPYRIDGVDFHLGLIQEMHDRKVYNNLVRFDILTPLLQIYGNSAIVSYTRLMTYRTDLAPIFKSFNETRVFVRLEGGWKMVHFHRSGGA